MPASLLREASKYGSSGVQRPPAIIAEIGVEVIPMTAVGAFLGTDQGRAALGAEPGVGVILVQASEAGKLSRGSGLGPGYAVMHGFCYLADAVL